MVHLLAALAHGRRPLSGLAALLLAATAAAAPPRVLVARYGGVISPVAAEYLGEAVRRAAAGRFDALVVELDTPGGLDLSMRDIVKSFLASEVPVIVYVHPAGGRAASAGVFITMAAHVAAMTPGTNIGAAHPVQLGGAPAKEKGEKPDAVMQEKMTNDMSAYLEALAARRGRNVSWAREVVANSSSVASGQAVAMRVVDLEAESLGALLEKIDGRRLPDFKEPLRTRDALLERLEMTPRQRLLAAVADPNVSMVLMTLGVSGLLIELYHPGLILPGVVGAVSLVLAFYAFQTLSANYAGVLLILLAFVLYLLELKIVSFGLLALGGTAALLFGAMMLFQGPAGWGGVSPGLLLSLAASFLLGFGAVFFVVRQALSRRSQVGREGLKGARARVVERIDPVGMVSMNSELWRARSAGDPIAAGSEVEIVSVDGLTLTVRPVSG